MSMSPSVGTATLTGNLGTISVQDVLGFLGILRVIGLMEIDSPDGALSIYLHSGVVVWGRAHRGGRRPGQLLVDRGVLSEAELEEVRTRSARASTIYAALVDRGLLEPDAVEAVATEELCENLYRLFTWRPGTFRFFEAATVPPGVQAVRIEVQALLLEAARRLDEWGHLPEIYSDPESRFELMAEPAKNEEKVSLDLDEWRLLYLVSSRRSLGRIWRDSPLASRLETSRMLYGLAVARLLRPVSATLDETAGIGERPPRHTGAMPVPEDLAGESPAPSMPAVQGPGTIPLPGPELSRRLRLVAEPSAAEPSGPSAPESSELLPSVDLPPLPPNAEAAPSPALAVPSAERPPTPSRRLTRAQIRVERSGRLVVVEPEDDGRIFAVGTDGVTLGRAPINDVVLADGHVSVRHGRIGRDGDDFVLEDTGSSNGLRVNGRRTLRSLLRGGEEIEVFPFKLRFELDFEIFESSGEVVVPAPPSA